MGHKFGWPTAGAIAPAAALLILLTGDPATAGDVSCGDSGEGCARINGYIRAGDDLADPAGRRPARLAPPQPLFAGPGAAAPQSADPRGGFYLDVSHDEWAR